VVVRISPGGTRLSVVPIDNSPAALAEAVTAAGDHPQLVLEATCGWYWAVDALQATGANVHLVAPSKLTASAGGEASAGAGVSDRPGFAPDRSTD
jgi:hypothetical protein